MTKRQGRDAIYVKRQFDTEIIVLCVLVHSLSPELSTPHCDDGRARRDHFSHDGRRESYMAREAARAFSRRIALDLCQVNRG